MKMNTKLGMHIYSIVAAFVQLAEALTTIFTLGFYTPGWTFSLVVWHARKLLKEKYSK